MLGLIECSVMGDGLVFGGPLSSRLLVYILSTVRSMDKRI
jgi:hypothetical protein